MEFNPDDDHPSERELKLQVVRIYNWKLDERNERKRFAIDRGLVDIKKQQTFEKKLSKEDRELVSRLRVFARLHSPAEHDALVDGILRAKKLRNHIETLQHYRKMGLKTIEQIKRYEADKKKREADQRIRMKRDTSIEQFVPYDLARSQSVNSNHSGGMAAANGGFVAVSSNGNSSKDNTMMSRRRGRGMNADLNQDYVTDDAMTTAAEPSSSNGNNNGNGNSNGNGNAASAVLVDISRYPGYEHLTAMEAELCSKIPLLPLHFLAVKEAVVR